MSDQPEKLDLASQDIADDKRQELLRLFPEIRTEGGKLDFERLKLALGEAVDVGKERYGMNWPGKAECFKTIQSPSMGTLRPCPEESVNFDTTENLIIEGDNLESLKLLQKSYLGKVKMIYIDPPYNTGNDFIYPDNFSESLQTYLEYTGQVDAEGRKFGTNTDADGRFHSKWLNMMYPRLYLARNLLTEDGVIFVSINDVEAPNLRRLCDEVFGEDNFVAQIVWQRSKKGDSKQIASVHEYIVCYCRNKVENISKGLWRQKKEGVDEVLAQYEKFKRQHAGNHDKIRDAMVLWFKGLADNDPRKAHKHYNWSDDRGLYFAADFAGPDDGRASRPRHDIIHPITGMVCKKPSTGWRWDEEKTKWALEQVPIRIHFGPDETTIPNRKSYLKETSSEPFSSVFYRDGRSATLEVESLVGKGVFPFPKNKEVLSDLIALVTKETDIVLDYFAGSGTTAHAVLETNKIDGNNRKFVLIQLPEPTERVDYRTIADITKDRVRRAINKLNDDEAGKLDLNGTNNQDRGFRVFKLTESNFKPWNADVPQDAQSLEKQLELHIDHIRQDRTADDLLYEILLKSGFPLTTPVEKANYTDKTVYSVAGGALLICLERTLTIELIRAMADSQPERVVCLDEGFAGNDQLKANAVQLFKTKGVTSFKTV